MPLSKNTIKYLRSLHLKKFRQNYANFIIEGDKMAREILETDALELEGIYALAPWIATNAQALRRFDDRVFKLSLTELEQISLLTTPNQALVVVRNPDFKPDIAQLAQGLSLYLDGIQDPGNAGAILRIADWFGIRQVLFAPGSIEIYHPKLVQASMGAILRVNCAEAPLESLVSKLPANFPVYGAAMEGESIYTAPLTQQGILVIGNEGNGISEAAQQLLTRRITIPADPAGGAESLNAAIAAGIICAFFRKTT
jgi:TrmH family RNA methyltransferase